MSSPKGMLITMAAVLALIGAACGLLFAPLLAFFMSFPAVNAAILAVLAAGIAASFWQVWALQPATQWTDQVSRGFAVSEPPRLVAPVARVIGGREREGVTLSVLAMRSFLEMVRERVDQGRVVPRALMALIVVLGVLGVLWALMEGAPSGAVTSVALFALASAVVLGLMQLLVRFAESRFMAGLEDFLSSRAQLPSSLLGGEGTLPAYLEALLKQTAESLSDIQRMMLKGEEERRTTDAALDKLEGRLGELIDQLREERKMIFTLARNHNDLQPVMTDLTNHVSGALAGTEEMRNHLRSVDMQLARVVEELRAVREQVPLALRQEIRLLAQTISASGGRARPEPLHSPSKPPPPEPAAPPREAAPAEANIPPMPKFRDPRAPSPRRS